MLVPTAVMMPIAMGHHRKKTGMHDRKPHSALLRQQHKPPSAARCIRGAGETTEQQQLLQA